MTLTAHVPLNAARRSLWRVFGIGALCAGATGGFCLLCYRSYLLKSDLQCAGQLSNIQPPVRRTRPYVAGDGSRDREKDNNLCNDSCKDEVALIDNIFLSSLSKPIFYALVVFRVVLLIAHMVPVLWYSFLTYGLHLCTEQVLFEKLCDALTAMGPSYIKLGQWMATRPDIFSPLLSAALEKLYDNTSPHSWSHTEGVLRRTFRETSVNYDVFEAGSTTLPSSSLSLLLSSQEKRLEKGRELLEEQVASSTRKNALYYLQEIETLPVNSGSIAQVYRGSLREEVDGVPAGTIVAIKVMHPFVREYILADIAAMRFFVNIFTFLVPSSAYFDLKNGVSEFAHFICSQLDLRQECDNLRQFIYNFRDFPGIVFPTPLPSLCTADVLVETFEEGQPLQEIHGGDNYRDVAECGCHMFLKMLFEDNFVHSDLHPGNMLLRTNPGAPLYGTLTSMSPSSIMGGTRNAVGKAKLYHELVVLDAGLVTTLSKEERNNFIALFAAVACGDGKLGADLMLDRMPERRRGRKRVDRAKFRADMQAIFNLVSPETSAGFKLSTIRIGPVLGKIMNTLREHSTPIDGNFASLVLTVIIGEGLGRKLTPDFNIFAEAAPYLIALLEDSELYYLASKLRETYGTIALLRDSVYFVKPERTITYTEMTAKKVMKTLDRFSRIFMGNCKEEKDFIQDG